MSTKVSDEQVTTTEQVTEELTKVTDEQLTALREIEQDRIAIIRRLGELAYERQVFEQYVLELEARRLQAARQIQETMGTDGHVDLNTGEFIPVSQ